MNPQIYRLILADDHDIMLDGLSEIISTENNLKIVDYAKNGKDLIISIKKHKPDLCIVDIDMPILNGLQASEIIKKQFPEIKIIILSMHQELSILKKIKSISVEGYLTKTCDKEDLIYAINKILKGKTYYTQDLTQKQETTFPHKYSDISKLNLLSKRELEVTKLLCIGDSNTKIASKLFISPKTVDNHRTSIMRKLEVHNIVELTRLCIRNNI